MTDPKRLSLTSESEIERRLLAAGRVSAPPGSKERALLVAAGVLSASGGAAASKGTALGAAKAGSIASLKWIGIVGLTGIGAVAGTVALHEVREHRAPAAIESASLPTSRLSPVRRPHSSPERSPEVDQAWTPAPIDPLTLTHASAEVLTASAPAQGTFAAEAGAPAASTVPAELALLEQARSALVAGDPALSVSVLDSYTTRFPRGSMAPEAAMLRVEALLKAGDRSDATRAADALLAGDPDSPYAARVRSLLGTSNE
jgi:hypothetical protein